MESIACSTALECDDKGKDNALEAEKLAFSAQIVKKEEYRNSRKNWSRYFYGKNWKFKL